MPTMMKYYFLIQISFKCTILWLVIIHNHRFLHLTGHTVLGLVEPGPVGGGVSELARWGSSIGVRRLERMEMAKRI